MGVSSNYILCLCVYVCVYSSGGVGRGETETHKDTGRQELEFSSKQLELRILHTALASCL